MSDPMDSLTAHLAWLEEWPIAGFSTDPAWTTRAASGREAPSGAAREGELEPETVGPPLSDGATTRAERPADPGAVLAAIRADLGECTRCKLHGLGRRQIVFGVGSPDAQLMFVGEAPGQDEDIQGYPFVGRAGQLLTKIIEAMGMRREDVYIANVIKCRPPGNRNPEPEEVATCEPFLFRQIDAIRPKAIVALGTFAAKALLRTSDPISKLRGRPFKYRGATLVPTFHPAFLLRSPQFKRDTWEDMKKVIAILQAADEPVD